MAAPTNISATTAIPISLLPAVLTQNVHDAGTTYTVWYKYIGTATDTVVGMFAFGDLVGYTAQLSVWLDPGGPSEENYLSISSNNRPVQFPVTEGVSYYLKIASLAGNVSPSMLTLKGSASPNEAAPAGSILVNDDTDGYPLAILDATDGHILQFCPQFPAGEQGQVLTDGTILVNDVGPDQNFKIYAPTLAVQAEVSLPGAGLMLSSTNQTDTFYLGRRTAQTVTTTATDGTLGPTTYTLPALSGGLRGFAPSPDETILYYAGMAEGVAIKRWDLVNNLALSDLAAGVAGYLICQDILVLTDGTIIVGYRDIAAPTDFFVRHYSAAGAVLHTYPFGTVVLNRLSYAVDDPASFWAWLFSATVGESTFQNLRISDGVVIGGFSAPRFEGGIYAGAATATPQFLFGHDNSCPFLVTRTALPPGTCGGPDPGDEDAPPYVAPSYYLDARYIRRLRRAPHLTQENQRVFYRRFELDLERGVGLAEGQGTDPLVLLRLSRDGGQTWGEEIRMSAGALGAYTQRVIARRLGQARDTVFEVTVSDPVAWTLVGAWLDLEAGTN